MIIRFLVAVLLLLPVPALAQTFPELTGRVVDQADLLTPQQESELSQRLEALQSASTRQLVVATVNGLEDYPIEDYGYRLGRHWGIGQDESNNGIILLVAPNERKVRIEVGYGLEAIMTDALSNQIIQNVILPRFRAEDYPGGIIAGADAIIEQLQAPPELAEQRALEAAQSGSAASGEDGGSIWPVIFWVVVLIFIVIPLLKSGFGGRKYRGRRRRGGGPIVIWGPGLGSFGSGSSSSSWGSSGGGWSGGGGFSGGGGSFGGGGASGGW